MFNFFWIEKKFSVAILHLLFYYRSYAAVMEALVQLISEENSVCNS